MESRQQRKEKLLSVEEIFAAAASKFQAGLSDEDKIECKVIQGPQDLVTALEQHIKSLESRHQSRLLAACTKIDDFGKAIKQYFEVVNIFVSSQPDWAGILRGAACFVFQLSCNYVMFFEKLAIMYQQMAEHLPSYHQHLDMLGGRAKNGKWGPSHERLVKSLSFVYTDIMQFCCDCRNLFYTKRMDIRSKAKIIMDLMWTPFDVRFSKILLRFDKHRKLFEGGLDDVYKQEMLWHYDAIEEELQGNAKAREASLEKIDKMEADELQSRKSAIRHWISAPSWRAIYNDACRSRTLRTGEWFFNDPTFCKWAESGDISSKEDFSHRVLIVSGKPGYGKTVLSSFVIDHLQEKLLCSGKDVVVFFHFDQQHRGFSCSSDAFRSVLTQLLHVYSANGERDLVDIASLIMNATGSGQNLASEEDVLDILGVYIKRCHPSYFVFDGMDECSNYTNFILDLEQLTSGTKAKILLFGRPHLRYPNVRLSDTNHILLSTRENLQDLKTYLHPHILALLDKKAIARKRPDDAGVIAAHLSHNSNSIFLWATLMVAYLKSPSLTSKERLDTIEQVNLFTGLDVMFTRILERVEKSTPRTQWNRIQNTFQMLTAALRPLEAKELKILMAVKRDTAMSEDDQIQDFDDSLVQMCGSLVEIRPDQTVAFIHLSVSEFLTQVGPRPSCPWPFHVQLHAAHRMMAIQCISYMLNEVPHSPLSGCSSTTITSELVDMRFPLLQYSALNWVSHVQHCLQFELIDDIKKLSTINEYKILLSQILKAVSSRELVSMWIETGWIFGIPPSLRNMPLIIKSALEILEVPHLGEVATLTAKLESLSTYMSNLELQWSRVLELNPNEIWLPSIQTFTKSELSVGSNVSSLVSLSSPEDVDAILLASKVSDSGSEVGVLKVWPSHNSKTRRSCQKLSPWKASYQIWSLETMKEIKIVRFEIPACHTSFQKDKYNADRQAFRLPVTFSPSLNLIAIGDVILQTNRAIKGTIDLVQPESQAIQVSSCHFFPTIDRWPNIPQKAVDSSQLLAEELNCHAHLRGSGEHDCYQWYHYSFSPDERFFLMLEGHGPPDIDVPGGPWVLNTFENSTPGSVKPLFKLVAMIQIGLRIFRASTWSDGSPLSSISCFHPSKPVLAVCASGRTSLWKFSEAGNKLIEVYGTSLNNMQFSKCGNYLYGLTIQDKIPVFLYIEPHLSNTIKSRSGALESPTAKQQLAITVQFEHLRDGASCSLVDAKERTLSSTTMPVFSKDRGQLQLSALRQNNNDGEVTLTTARADGTKLHETITKLPKSTSLEQSYSTLVPSNCHRNLRIVLNMAAQDSYLMGESADFALPLVLDRQRNTIPSFSWKDPNKRGLESYQECSGPSNPHYLKRSRYS